MTLAIIASVALLYAFCLGIGAAFGSAAGMLKYGLAVGASFATGLLLFGAATTGVAYLWEAAT